MRLAFTISGILVLLGAGIVALENLVLPRLGASADAIVTELVRYKHSEQGSSVWYTYKPVLRFEDDNGEIHERESNLEVDPGELARGDELTVYYWPTQPERAVVPTAGLWFLPGLFLPIGVAFFLTGRLWAADGSYSR